MKKILLALLFILLGTGLYFYSKFSYELRIATGFSAKNICSGHFISGFSGQQVLDEALIPLSKFFEAIDFQIDESKKVVSTKMYGMFESISVFNPATGCHLLSADGNIFNQPIKLNHAKPIDQSSPWPIGLGKVNQGIESIDYSLLDQALLTAFSEPNNSNVRQTKAIAVVYKGQLVAEKYAEGISKTTPLLSWSMAKSVTNMLVGLLVKDGKLNLYQSAPVPQWQQEGDPRHSITLDQLMRMSSGLEFKEIYGLGSDAARMLSVEDSASNFASNKPLKYKPDEKWAYSSGTTNIVSGIIRRQFEGDDQAYRNFPQKRLFNPLSISTAVIETDPSGTFIGSSYMYASARDWAKLGQLMLQQGVWQGENILTREWVDYSISATKTNLDNSYAAQFWLNAEPQQSSTVGHKASKWPNVPHDAYYMGGFQGQVVVVIPSKDLVIVRLGFTKPGTDKGIEALLEEAIKSVDSKTRAAIKTK